LLKITATSTDILSSDIVVAEDIDRAVSCLREFVEGKARTRFLYIFFLRLISGVSGAITTECGVEQ
jgi:hypothetical protein